MTNTYDSQLQSNDLTEADSKQTSEPARATSHESPAEKIFLLPDEAEKIIFTEDTAVEKPPLLENVPHFQLESVIAALPLLNKHAEFSDENYFSFLANGNWAMIIKTKFQGKDVVMKLFYGSGLNPEDATKLTEGIGMTDETVANTQNLTARNRSTQWHQDALKSIGGFWRKFQHSLDSAEDARIAQEKIAESIQMEAGALKRANALKNNWVPPVRAMLTYQGRPCGYIMPQIKGTFASVAQIEEKFPHAAQAKAELEQAGILIDYSDNHNAAILEQHNTPVFFDMSLRDPSELQMKN